MVNLAKQSGRPDNIPPTIFSPTSLCFKQVPLLEEWEASLVSALAFIEI